MPLEEIVNEARDNAIRDSYNRLKETEDFKKRNKMGKLYMMCLDLDYSHNKLYPRLAKLGIKL